MRHTTIYALAFAWIVAVVSVLPAEAAPPRRRPQQVFRLPETGQRVRRFGAREIQADTRLRLHHEVRRKLINDAEKDNWLDLISSLIGLKLFPAAIPMPFSYTSHDQWGNEQRLTGVVIAPLDLMHKEPRSVPILAFNHGTQVERKWSPSYCTFMKILDDPAKNVLFGTLMALAGYIVVLPDYPGLGDNYDVHPYCQSSLAHSVVDVIKKGRDVTADDSGLRALPPWSLMAKWNGKVYLMGYSEGGYATMVAARELQDGADNSSLSVSGVAPLDGPYSLSQTMRELMLGADPTYLAPFFLPYVVNGYDAVYYSSAPAGQQKPEFNYMNNVLNQVPGIPDFAAQLRTLMDGSHTFFEISAYMKNAVPWEGPRSILTPAFKDALNDPNGVIVKTLAANDAYADWVPQMPLMMFHHKYDDLVPYGNAQQALAAFVNAKAPYVGLMPFSAHVGDPARMSMHGAAAPVAYLLAFEWLNYLASTDDPARIKWPTEAH